MRYCPCAPTAEASDTRSSAPAAEADLTLRVRGGFGCEDTPDSEVSATLEQALSNVLPQTSGATQYARSTLPATDPTAITDDPLRPVAEQTHIEITTSWGDVHRFLTLYFCEVSSDIHGPLHFKPDERIEQIQQWLEEDTFRSRCVDEETGD